MKSWVSLAGVLCLACGFTGLHALADNVPSQVVPGYIGKIDSGHLVEIYKAGENLRWSITLRNSSEKPMTSARLSWTVSSWAQRGQSATLPITGERVVSLAPKTESKVEIAYSPEELGWFELVLELRDGAGELKERQVRSFSVGATTRSTGRDFRYGICTHLGRQMDTPFFDKELELAERLGVDTMRGGLVGWERIQPDESQWNFSKSDILLAAIEARGIAVQPLLGYSPRWASTGNPNDKDWNEWNKKAPRMDPWLNYVRAMIDRYSARARYWEVWNEPDISFWRSPTDQYTKLFNATAALIKKQAPGVQVLNGGLAMIKRTPNLDFVGEFVSAATQKDWDVFAYHDYHTFPQFLARRREVGTVMSRLRPDMPIWINEGGFQTLLAGGEREQALVLVKKISSSPAFGIGAYFWYNLRDDGLNPKEPEHHFGLTHYDGQPKPSWSAYQALIRELGAARYLSSMPAKTLPSGAWAHLYQLPESKSPDAATQVLVLWQEGGARQTPSWLGVGPDARITHVTDIMGNPVDISLAKNGAAIKLTEEPVYVHIRSASSVVPELALKSLLETAPLAILIPGQRTSLSAQVNNPLDRPVVMQLDWSSNLPDLKLSERTEKLKVSAGGHINSAITFLLPEGSSSAVTDPHIGLVLSIPETGLQLPARIPVSLALPVNRLSSSASDLSIPASITPITLIRSENIHNLYSAEPLPEMHWSGPYDLGVNARVAYDTSGLRMVIEVADDIHIQDDIREGLWNADGLQIGLRLNETDSGYIELGLARSADGKVGGWVFSTLPHIPLVRGRLGAPVRYDVSRSSETSITTYRLHLPWKELGLDGPPSGGFRLNFIVNDSDGKGRKQWVQLSDGLGDQKTPALWRVFSCQ